ncbi:MAG: phage portal protein [Pseudomonadota bacterium]
MADFSIMGTLSRALTISRPAPTSDKKSVGVSVLSGMGGWFSVVREGFTGAWQRGEELRVETALSHPALFRCISLISSDIGKMCLDLVEEVEDGVWEPTTSPAFSPVLTKPNHYQNRIQFFTQWVISKFVHGNTYVLKERDNRGVVVAHYVLDPLRVRPLVTPDGGVYYQLGRDNLSFVEDAQAYVPASEIIHDRWNCYFHPLVGLSPIYACGLAAMEGQEIQRNATRFFRNGSQPGGILTAPDHIDDDTAKRIKDYWDEKFTGENVGKVAVLGDGLKYESMSVNANDAQMIESLKWTSETICSVLGVPAYMAGVGPAPLNNNVEALAQQYYSQCLQIHIESIELCLDEGLKLPAPYGLRFDLDDLLRMDTATQITTLKEAVTGGLMKPDEARAKLSKRKVTGGDAVYLQQQNFSLAALAKRDAKADPFSGAKPAAPAADAQPPAANDLAPADAAAAFESALDKATQPARAA